MITIVAYMPIWPDEFIKIGQEVRHALGDLALRIDHIGSTAVPGLAAKDIIDIQITARSLDSNFEEALLRGGYQRLEHITQDHVPPGEVINTNEWMKWMFKPSVSERAINVHVRLQGRSNQRYALLFRDYLRAHPAIALAYAQVKQGLVNHGFDNPDAYYDVKDPVCDIIMGGANTWAETTEWELGPSDC